MFMAMNPGTAQGKVEGIATTEPVYGLPALWITQANKENAELNGYTVIDPESVFITHLSETLRKHTDDLLTREDVQLLVDRLRKSQPSLVGEVVGPDREVSVGLLQRVLKCLLRDGIPIRELTAILESLGENASKIKSAAVLTEMVRKRLARAITEMYKSDEGAIVAITLDPTLEHLMTSTLQKEAEGVNLTLPTEEAMNISQKTAQIWRGAMDKGYDKVVLLCDSRLRLPLAAMLSRTVSLLPVLAYDEIVLGTEVQPLETISVQGDESMMPMDQELAAVSK
jgi:flagellar biosynthesis protein FlhA